MPVTSLKIENVGPFDEIEFDFDPQVNIFTGPNNSGKSSALWVLGDITVYPFMFPGKLLRDGEPAKFQIRLMGGSPSEFEGELPCLISLYDEPRNTAAYWTKERSNEYVAVMKMLGYSKFIPALRRSTDFRSEGPTSAHKDPDERETRPPAADIHRVAGRTRTKPQEKQDPELKKRLTLVSDNASLVSDEAIIEKIIELDYRSYLKRRPEFRDLIVKIGEVASEITDGFPIEFIGVNEDTDGFFPEFRTIDGAVPLNTMSQGTQSIIQWLAHLLIGYAEYYEFPEHLEKMPGILIIDEIDAHLHPSWQQRVIPALTRNFPNLQIFCSTHSPLMLGGLKEGQVQLLRRDENGKVTVTRNEVEIVGWTSDEILRNFLGVHDPTDLETVGHLERLQHLRNQESLSVGEADELERLRHVVSQDLLGGQLSNQLAQFAETLRITRTDSTPSSKPTPTSTAMGEEMNPGE